ncbi:hypothetical protein AP053_gp026 [Ostreococcus mediterraneus virus 1]|uniref:hypothetical protein n=1 Tax=Ostreococcus mediterraneus virus 1 TaxID=1663210 RepID=UPI0006CF388F|nr:hypothetical protein AP053_gp026 [Ostreococcus mediterraneus virus 1]ALI95137.1 hypothetical protein OmV1_026c [Ostreococcus mediterraneus virus 1]
MFVDVQCEDDTIQIAELIRDENTHDAEVIFLTKLENGLYDFEDDITVIPTESICGWYDCKTLEETELFMKAPGGYALLDDSDDEDYVCSDEGEDSDSESLIDEDEDEA